MIKEQRTITTQQGDIAVVQLGNPKGVPVLALHGWLDNAASFYPLGDKLSDVCLYALDLAGHGHSYHRAYPYNYNLWDDLIDVLEVADQLQLETIRLLGHSRGARIASLLAASSDRVSALGLLDGFLHTVSGGDKAPINLRDYLAKRRRGKLRGLRYASIEAMVETRTSGWLPLQPEAAQLIVERNCRAIDGGYTWRTDQALRWRSAVHFSDEQTQGFIDATTCPTALWLARDGILKVEKAFIPSFKNAQVQTRECNGGHHFHMETEVDKLAAEIDAFYSAN